MSTRLLVLECLCKAGDNGCIDCEIQHELTHIHPSTLRGCRKQLEKDGCCVAIDGMARTIRNHPAKVHIATIKGMQEYQATYLKD
jgi:hypothetical protein